MAYYKDNKNSNYQNRNNNRYDRNRPSYHEQNKDKEGEKKMKGKKCPLCGHEMKCKGASDCVGSISWKCKKCGRRLWICHKLSAPPAPLTYNRALKYGNINR